jgi:hypothetical protein
MMVLHGLFVVTKWNTTSDRLNFLINWLAIAGYELIVILFSRLSPRWLTLPSAVILLIPLFASSTLFPLTGVFELGSPRSIPIGNHLFYNVSPWGDTGGGNAGVDVFIYYHPPLVPFLRHKLQTIPFNDEECNANAAFVVILPTTKTVLGRCPRWPSQSAGVLEKLLPLP